MMWRYSVHETKTLLMGTLVVASAYGFLIADSFPAQVRTDALTGNTVGITAGVAPNELNTKALALAERERELEVREASLNTTQSATRNDRTALIFSSVMGLILLGLILLNFYLDGIRRGTVPKGSGSG